MGGDDVIKYNGKWDVHYSYEGAIPFGILAKCLLSAMKAFANSSMVVGYDWSNGAGIYIYVRRPKGFRSNFVVDVPEEIVKRIEQHETNGRSGM